MIDIFDNVLEDHIAELIHVQMQDVSWKYEHRSERVEVNKHWHVLCGNNEEEVKQNGFDWLLSIWNVAFAKYNFKEKYGITSFRRMYLNAHTHGIEPHPHIDDGTVTMIYYPRIDWKREWGGGTAIWDNAAVKIEEISDYVGNRLTIFPAFRQHQALPVSRQCYELRPVLVFKTTVDPKIKAVSEDWMTTRESIPEKYIEYLEQLGTDKVAHTNGLQSLMDHLIGVKNLLKRMNVPEYVQDAGLFHSIYGTIYFNTQSTNNREEVRQLIGTEAEELVYLFCSLEHPRIDKIKEMEDTPKRYALRMIERANAANRFLVEDEHNNK